MDSAPMDISVLAFRKHPLREFATAVGIMMLLAGCGGSGGSGSFAPNTPASPGGELPAGDEPAGVFNESSFLLTTNETRLYKVSPVTGLSEEIITFGGGIEFVEPLDVIGDTVYSTADDNTINAIDLETGELLWETGLGNHAYLQYPTGVVCDSRTCWARGSTGLLMAVSASDGRVKWSRPLHPNGVGNEDKLNGSDLLVTSDRIYLSIHKQRGTSLYPGLVEPSMIVVDRNDGSIIKRLNLEYAAYEAPEVIGNTLLVSTWGEILAYDKNSFELLWRINDPALGYTTATVIGNVMVAGVYDSNDHYVIGFDLSSGQQLWSVPAGSSDNAYSSTTDGQLIYAMVGGLDTSAYYTPPGDAAMAINPENGSIVWIKDGLRFVNNPLVAFGHAFYGYYWDVLDDQLDRNPSGLTSVNARTGDVEWVNSRLDTPGIDWFTTTPVLVHEGVLYRTSLYPDVMP